MSYGATTVNSHISSKFVDSEVRKDHDRVQREGFLHFSSTLFPMLLH